MIVPPKLLSFLKEEEKFFIATHINPEPDAIGSAIALSMALVHLGKETVLYDRDTVPEFYRFLPGHERFIHLISHMQTSSFNLILLDCNTPERAGLDDLPFRSSVVIDHHETEREFGDIRWIEPDVAATGILIFYLIRELDIFITSQIATNLYAAVTIDTGTFRYSNTSAEVLRVAAELVESGANPEFISSSLYETWSQQRYRLLIMALNTLEVIGNIAFMVVTKEMFRNAGANAEDTENFAGFAKMMKDVELSVLCRQIDDNTWRVSLRSKGDINVARIASLYGGGGHKNAAGFVIKTDLKTVKDKILEASKTANIIYNHRNI